MEFNTCWTYNLLLQTLAGAPTDALNQRPLDVVLEEMKPTKQNPTFK